MLVLPPLAMDTTPIQDGPLLTTSKGNVACVWTVKERDPNTGLYLPVLRRKNKITNYGLNALAQAWSGTLVAPVYMALETGYAQMQVQQFLGDMSIQTDIRVDVAGDNSITIAPGLSTQEACIFLTVTGTGPYTYTLSNPLTYNHPLHEKVVRTPRAADTVSVLLTEGQYDPTNAPGQRLGATAGFSPGTGIWTQQYYFSANQAVYFLSGVGLTDNAATGAGNLHNHCILGYDHTLGTLDLEIDVQLTLVGD